MRLNTALATLGLVALATLPAKADKLDDIIASGKLRCAVTLRSDAGRHSIAGTQCRSWA